MVSLPPDWRACGHSVVKAHKGGVADEQNLCIKVEDTATVNNLFHYAGYEYDTESSIYYLKSRHYDLRITYIERKLPEMNFIKLTLLRVGCILIFLFISSGCNFQDNSLIVETSSMENFERVMSDSKIYFSENQNWKVIRSYLERLGKPINDTGEEYENWECLGATAAGGVRFRDKETNIVYVFLNDEFDGAGDDSPASRNLILTGREICKGIGTNLQFFVPDFKSMNNQEQSMEYLEKELGINSALFIGTEGSDAEGGYLIILLENRVEILIMESEGILDSDSWVEISVLDDSQYEYWKRCLFNQWLETN